MFEVGHKISMTSDKLISISSIFYAQNLTRLQVRKVHIPVILNILFKIREWLVSAGGVTLRHNTIGQPVGAL
jgi:hypothetical protein